ncbi:hypothetical protein GCM10027440_15130 [Nocardiopsis coralliicola]
MSASALRTRRRDLPVLPPADRAPAPAAAARPARTRRCTPNAEPCALAVRERTRRALLPADGRVPAGRGAAASACAPVPGCASASCAGASANGGALPGTWGPEPENDVPFADGRGRREPAWSAAEPLPTPSVTPFAAPLRQPGTVRPAGTPAGRTAPAESRGSRRGTAPQGGGAGFVRADVRPPMASEAGLTGGADPAVARGALRRCRLRASACAFAAGAGPIRGGAVRLGGIR